LLSGTREKGIGRKSNVVREFLVRIKIGGSVAHSGELVLMEMITCPGMGSAGGRRVVKGDR